MAGAAEEEPIRKPDFFIVGAPRCGTTAMYDYLRQHPDIYMSPVKEPHFFGCDVNSESIRPSEERYLSLFADAAGEKRAGEASAWYLYSRTAAREIADFAPDARIIAMLRDPVEMMYSIHGEQVHAGFGDIPDFAEALAAEDDRRQGRRIPPAAHSPKRLLYSEIGRYAEQLERYFAVFGRERVHVIIFDDFARDTAAVYRETLRFLDVDNGFAADFQVKNAHKNIQRPGLWQAWRRTAGLPLVASAYKTAVPQRVRRRVQKAVIRAYTGAGPRQPMDPQLKARLRRELTPEVERLSALLGRDLSRWTGPVDIAA